jgi:hypothetical protein
MLVNKNLGKDIFRRTIVIAVVALCLTAAAALSQNEQPAADAAAADAGQETVAVVAVANQDIEPAVSAGSESVQQTGTPEGTGDNNIAEPVKVEEGTVTQTIQSISFKKDMTVRDALRFLAAKYQKNIIPSAKVDGQITISSLYNVTFQEALDSILGYQFKYDEEGNFIKV